MCLQSAMSHGETLVKIHNTFTCQINHNYHIMKQLKVLESILSAISCTVCICTVSNYAVAADTQKDLSGQMLGLVHWDGMNTTRKGVAIIPTQAEDWTGNLEYLWTTTGYRYNYGGCHFDDKYFCNFLRILDGYILEQKAYIYDDKTGEELDVIQLPTAFDLLDGSYYEPEETIYASVKDMSSGSYGWAKVNPKTARMEMIETYDTLRLYGVAMTEDGKAYGISGDGAVYCIDRASGTPTQLFSHEDLETKTEPKAHTGATWDEENQRIIFAVCNLEKDGGSRLFSVDPADKSVDLLYKLDGMGTQLAGLYIEQKVDPNAPAIATGLETDFLPGSLTGTFSFTLPDQSHGGEDLTGDIDYIVKIDGEKFSEGTGNGGSRIHINAVIDKAGWHTFYVQCSNVNGKGRSTKHETFIGYEAPLAASEFTARHYGGKMHLSWTASPATGANGGPVNVETIQYVIRSNHGEEFTTDPGATSHEYQLGIPENFTPWYYTLTARNADGESSSVESNNVPLGVIKGDYSQDFSEESSRFDFTTLNSNGDDKTWEWSEEGFMVIRYNEILDMDDYLTLPPLNMNQNDYYVLGFDAGVFNYEERLEIKLAEDYNQQGMDNAEIIYGPVTIPAKELREVSWQHHDVVVPAPDDNKYFIGIHGVSPADMNVLFVDNVSLRKLAGGTVPAAITEPKAIPDSKGKLRVTLSGKLPVTDVAGNPLEGIGYIKIMRGKELISTVNLSEGDEFEWTDEHALRGENRYTLITGNTSGEGLYAYCSAFAGFVSPDTPENCEIRYSGTGYDDIIFSWTPVSNDNNGLDISEDVTYRVIRALDGDMTVAGNGLAETEYHDSFKNLTVSQYAQYGVSATVDGLYGDMIVSPQIPVGPVCNIPLTEGFHPSINMPYGLTTDLVSEDSGLYTTNDTEQYQSADNDGGYGIFIGYNAGESATIYTAWIHIPQDAIEPVTTIQYYGEGDVASNYIHFGVNRDIMEEFELMETIETGGFGWQEARVSLDRYRGQDIRIALKFETLGNQYLRFDDFRVFDVKAPGSTDTLTLGELSVIGGKNRIIVRGTSGDEVRIHTVDGIKRYNGFGDVTVSVNPGLYVVSVGQQSVKVNVK